MTNWTNRYTKRVTDRCRRSEIEKRREKRLIILRLGARVGSEREKEKRRKKERER